MQLKMKFALTPALSPRRGRTICPGWNKPPFSDRLKDMQKLLPLPGGEGWGEGELFSDCIVTAKGGILFQCSWPYFLETADLCLSEIPFQIFEHF